MSVELKCFKLVAGQFIGPDYTSEPEPVLDKNTGDPVVDRRTKKPIFKLPSKKWNIGETVISPHDLASRPGHQFVFQGPYVPGSAKSIPAPTVPAVPPVPPKEEFYSEAELNEMTVADLNNLAAEEEIDLGGATKKSDIVKALLAAKS